MITLKLTDKTYEYIIGVLAQRPYIEVLPIISELERQRTLPEEPALKVVPTP